LCAFHQVPSYIRRTKTICCFATLMGITHARRQHVVASDVKEMPVSKSSTSQSQERAHSETGGEFLVADLGLKTIAAVVLVGRPNAGK
jgi:hypothetical protein